MRGGSGEGGGELPNMGGGKMDDMGVAFDLEYRTLLVSVRGGLKCKYVTSLMARRNASILPPDNPRSGDVCKRTVPSTVEAP